MELIILSLLAGLTALVVGALVYLTQKLRDVVKSCQRCEDQLSHLREMEKKVSGSLSESASPQLSALEPSMQKIEEQVSTCLEQIREEGEIGRANAQQLADIYSEINEALLDVLQKDKADLLGPLQELRKQAGQQEEFAAHLLQRLEDLENGLLQQEQALMQKVESLGRIQTDRHQEILHRFPAALTRDEEKMVFEHLKDQHRQASDMYTRRYYVNLIFQLQHMKNEAFAYFFEVADERIPDLIETGEYARIRGAVQAFQETIMRHAVAARDGTSEQVLQRWLEIYRDICRRLSVRAVELAEGEFTDPPAHLEALAALPREFLDPAVLTRVQEREEDLGRQLETWQKQEILEELDQRLENLDFSAEDYEFKLGELEARLRQIAHGIPEELGTLVTGVQKKFKARRKIALARDLIHSLFDNSEGIEQLLTRLVQFAERPYYEGREMAEIDRVINEVGDLVQHYDQLANRVGEEWFPMKVDTEDARSRLEHIRETRQSSYNLWALKQIRQAHDEFKKAKGLFTDTRKSVEELLTRTLWRIDERQLDPAVLILFGQTRQQILEAVDEKNRLELVEMGLKTVKASFAEIVIDEESPAP